MHEASYVQYLANNVYLPGILTFFNVYLPIIFTFYNIFQHLMAFHVVKLPACAHAFDIIQLC